jgi:hypothetical protein
MSQHGMAYENVSFLPAYRAKMENILQYRCQMNTVNKNIPGHIISACALFNLSPDTAPGI